MPLPKQDTADLFFPEPSGNPAGTAQAPQSMVCSLCWWLACAECVLQALGGLLHIARVLRSLWFVAIHATTFFMILLMISEGGLQPPFSLNCLGIPTGSLGNFSRHLTIAEYHLDSFDTLEQRLTAIESRVVVIQSRLNLFHEVVSSSQLDSLHSLSARVAATEAHMAAWLEGSYPRNFAKRVDGACYLKALTSPSYNLRSSRFFQYFKSKDSSRTTSLSTALDDTMTSDCWEFSGPRGQLGVRLSEQTRIAAVSIIHPHRRTLPPAAAGKAPKTFALWALYSNTTSFPVDSPSRDISQFLLSSRPHSLSYPGKFILLVNGTYDLSLSTTHQYFNVSSPLYGALSLPSDIVILEILDNWGSNTTCLYNIGIHEEFV